MAVKVEMSFGYRSLSVVAEEPEVQLGQTNPFAATEVVVRLAGCSRLSAVEIFEVLVGSRPMGLVEQAERGLVGSSQFAADQKVEVLMELTVAVTAGYTGQFVGAASPAEKS